MKKVNSSISTSGKGFENLTKMSRTTLKTLISRGSRIKLNLAFLLLKMKITAASGKPSQILLKLRRMSAGAPRSK
jgi:hypothetical protein